MARRPGGQGPVDWEAGLRQLGKRWGSRSPKMARLVYLIPVAIVVLIWLLSGIYQVGPGERGVVRTFGARQIGDTNPGLHYHIPWPIQRVNVVNVESVRTVELGFTTIDGRQGQEAREVLSEALMLTGDENVVNIHAIIQYRVRDAGDYVFNIVLPDDALKSAAEVALRGIVGRNTIDYVLVEVRTAVENETQAFLQTLMDTYNSGIAVLRVTLQEVDAPMEVRDA
ncbi:MAG: protease modulator HflK, partial [Dehalococcoidia bacterium]